MAAKGSKWTLVLSETEAAQAGKPQRQVRLGSIADVFAFLHEVRRVAKPRAFDCTFARPAGLTAGGFTASASAVGESIISWSLGKLPPSLPHGACGTQGRSTEDSPFSIDRAN